MSEAHQAWLLHHELLRGQLVQRVGQLQLGAAGRQVQRVAGNHLADDGGGFQHLAGGGAELPDALLHCLAHAVRQGEVLRLLAWAGGAQRRQNLPQEEWVAAGRLMQTAGQGRLRQQRAGQMLHHLFDRGRVQPVQSQLTQQA